jgi:two-component system response regulator CpxR
MNVKRQESPAGRLLLVDDDAELCRMLKEFFRESGYLVDFELEGTSVAARAATGVYQLLILDVMLPRVSGFELLRTIRGRSRIPILMLTARTGRTDRVQSLEMGADDYLLKPFLPEELLARVRGHPAALGCLSSRGIRPSSRV